jgi:hypothetical protein
MTGKEAHLYDQHTRSMALFRLKIRKDCRNIMEYVSLCLRTKNLSFEKQQQQNKHTG